MKKLLSHRRAFTLVEAAVAVGLVALVIGMAMGQMKFFTRNARTAEVNIDQMQALQVLQETMENEVRGSREILFPPAGAAPARALFLRNFEGQIISYYYIPARKELRRAVMDLAGTSSERGWNPVGNLEGVYFTRPHADLVSWGMFASATAVLGAARRENR